MSTARCYYEFCNYPATWHIKDYGQSTELFTFKGLWGDCDLHHRVGYIWAGKPVYGDCIDCKEEEKNAALA